MRSGLREQGSRGHLILDLRVPFPEGWSEVMIRVRATSARGIKSRVASLHRRYEPPPEVSGRLFLLALGVQDYDDDRLDLGYALLRHCVFIMDGPAKMFCFAFQPELVPQDLLR